MSGDVCRLEDSTGPVVVKRSVEERIRDFEPVYRPFSTEEARQVARRCLQILVCTYCDVCELLCPDLCITRDLGSGKILIDLDHCKGCGLCAHFCPKGAIEMQIEKSGG